MSSKIMHRFFVIDQKIENRRLILTGSQGHQIQRVLRLGPGEHIVVLDNKGSEFEFELVDISKDGVLCCLVEERRVDTEPVTKITLFQSMLGREKLELVLQKCTEIGICRFAPIITERSLVRNADSVRPAKMQRWERIITEAAEQSHRVRIPVMDRPVTFAKCLESLAEFDLALLGSLGAEATTLRSCLASLQDEKPQSIALLIGPEGGFTGSELERAGRSGALSFSLGPRVLRTETAAIVTTALVLHELGQMEK